MGFSLSAFSSELAEIKTRQAEAHPTEDQGSAAARAPVDAPDRGDGRRGRISCGARRPVRKFPGDRFRAHRPRAKTIRDTGARVLEISRPETAGTASAP